ncbi:lysoplasmalogenase [bacterium]|nr:lysoplasmalogenase [bacterium]
MPIVTIAVQLTIIAITALLCIAADFSKRERLFVILKPVTTMLIIALAAQSDPSMSRDLLFAGLVFSLVGDTALIKRDDGRFFRIGLIAFLITHLFYIAAFSIGVTIQITEPGIIVVLVLLALLLYGRFRPGLGSLKIPVIIYMTVISLMVERAASAFGSEIFTIAQAFRLFAGAVLFYISDIIVAWNRFVTPFPHNRINLLFYYAAQTLIVMSLF